MLHNDDSSRFVNSPAKIASSDFLWGADEIGRAIGRNRRQAFHLLNRGEIKIRKESRRPLGRQPCGAAARACRAQALLKASGGPR
jgi:hypothetical protein